MKKKRNFTIFIFSGIFMIVGVALLIGGILSMTFSRHFRESAEEIAAVITDIRSYRNSDGEERHSVYVEYTYGGRRYEDIKLSYYSSSMREGDTITLLCDPDNPEHVEAGAGLTLLYVILTSMGILFVVISVFPLAFVTKKSFRQKKVKECGRKLYATVEEIVLNTSQRVNGKHPYLIYCIWRDEYKDIVYRFKSDSIWTNPNLLLRPGDQIPVYVDEKDYRHYYVDAESVIDGRIEDYT